MIGRGGSIRLLARWCEPFASRYPDRVRQVRVNANDPASRKVPVSQ